MILTENIINTYFQFFENTLSSCNPDRLLTETKQLFLLYSGIFDANTAQKIIKNMKFLGIINNKYILKPFHFDKDMTYKITRNSDLCHLNDYSKIKDFLNDYHENSSQLQKLEESIKNTNQMSEASKIALAKECQYSSEIDKELAGVNNIVIGSSNHSHQDDKNNSQVQIKVKPKKLTKKDKIMIQRKLAKKRLQKNQQILKEEQEANDKFNKLKESLYY